MTRILLVAGVALAVCFAPLRANASSDVASAATVNSTISVTRSGSGSGSGTVTADSGAIDCGATCIGSYANGTMLTLTATPTGGSQFTGWMGPCTGTGACLFTVSGATTVKATFALPPLPTAALDVDGNADCDALTDGLIALRYMFGLTGAALVSNAIGVDPTRTTAAQIQPFLVDALPLLDIDANGAADALTDGLLAIRYLFGLTGDALTAGALSPTATRTMPAAVQAYVQGLCTPPAGSFQLNNSYVTGLASPTAMSYAPDGRLFITEQAGAVRIVTAQGQLLSQPFLVTTNMRSDEERGLLGIAFDPNFTTNNYIYIFYTENSLGARLSRFTANGNVVVPGSEVILLEYYNISGNHRGGDVHFGPDGKLYLALGDAGEPLESQTVTTYNGKILRLNSNGTIPGDNPTSFVTTSGQTVTPVGQYRAIWAFGLRNPYRFSFHPTTGKMHINDVGAGLWEEVNVGQAGRNYGWPTCEGLCSNTFAQNPIYVHERGIEGCAITGGAFYTGSQFPIEYRDDYFVIDYCSTWLRYLNASNNAQATFPLSIPMFSVDLKTATDGSLLIAGHGSGTISRLYFVSNGTNHDPAASASASPLSGPSPLAVTFDGTGSTDQDNDTLSYAWNFGDGATGTGAIAYHTYTTGGLYTATLTVTDGKGGSDTDTVSISVGAPPTATILTPSVGALYTAGDTIAFSGSASDPDDGVLPPSAFSWTVVFHHDAHTHPQLGPVNGVASGTFTIPTSGHTEENVWYRINLTVTDSAGLQSTVSRDVYPRKANITLSSNVPGTQVLLDGSPFATPYTFIGVAGVQRTIGVTSPQTIAGQGYQFGSWSDGGAQSHTIVTPSASTTYAVTMNVQTTPTLPQPTLNWRFNNSAVESMLNVPTSARGSIQYATDTAPIAGTNTASMRFVGATGTYLATDGTTIMNAWPAATTSTWVKITAATANGWSNASYHALLFKNRVLQTRIQKTSTGLKLVAMHSDGTNPFITQVTSTIAIPTDAWVNLVTVHQGTTVTLYINGQLAGSGSTGRTLGGASADGMDIIGHGGNYTGLLDDLRLWNAAFTQAQVQQIPLQ